MSKFNIEHYLETTVLPDLTKVTNPFLLGRSLWFAGRFADKIKPELTQQFLEATVTGLNPQQNVIVRIQASRAIFEFSVKIPGKHFFKNQYKIVYIIILENTQHLLKPYMSRILNNLIDLASKSSDESLCLILEVLGACIEVDEDTSAQFAPQISDLILAMLTIKRYGPYGIFFFYYVLFINCNQFIFSATIHKYHRLPKNWLKTLQSYHRHQAFSVENWFHF